MFLHKKLFRFNFSPRASSEILTHCILLNQHMEGNRSATDAKSDVASIPGGRGSGGHQGRNVIIT